MTLLRTTLAISAAAVAALAGSVTPAGTALLPGCSGQTLQQPFRPWLDPASYVLVPDGGLERRASGWTLGAGATVVTGNESFRVRSAYDRLSLTLPAGAWAQTPPMCVSLLHPTLRFFARGGALLSPLLVDVIYTDTLGAKRTLPVAAVTPSVGWAPTLPFAYLANATALPVVGGAASVAFRFRSAGAARWWVDDVYVDPFKGR